jgi:hypothetical protein
MGWAEYMLFLKMSKSSSSSVISLTRGTYDSQGSSVGSPLGHMCQCCAACDRMERGHQADSQVLTNQSFGKHPVRPSDFCHSECNARQRQQANCELGIDREIMFVANRVELYIKSISQ